MKCFYLIFATVFAATCCADISEKNDLIYREAWKQYQSGGKSAAIKMCTGILATPETPNVDKLHFLKTLLILRDDPNDRVKIDELIKKDLDCWHENQLYYN